MKTDGKHVEISRSKRHKHKIGKPDLCSMRKKQIFYRLLFGITEMNIRGREEKREPVGKHDLIADDEIAGVKRTVPIVGCY